MWPKITAWFERGWNAWLLSAVVLDVVFVGAWFIGWLPLATVDFVLLSLILFLAALFRPAGVFLLFIATLPFEVITIAPEAFPFMLRPYQWMGGILLLALAVRLTGKRTPWPLFAWGCFDTLLVLLPCGAVLSALVSQAPGSFRLALIVASYFALYLLGRVFLRSIKDAVSALPFFLLGSMVTVFFGLIQNILFLRGGESFSVMPGRPNAWMPEPDWLALYLLFALAIFLVLLVFERKCFLEDEQRSFLNATFVLLLLGLLALLVVFILTVSRSGWLGASAMLILFLIWSLFRSGWQWPTLNWKETLFWGNVAIIASALAVFVVLDFGLTRFDLLGRAGSTASGLQSITIACENEREVPEKILGLEELAPLGCRHIDLEAIENETSAGKFVTTVFRPDPNVEIRKNIYRESVSAIAESPLFGIGWGAIGEHLGTDERGAALNASNVFLELWLGSGLLGLVAFVWWIACSAVIAGRNLAREETALLALFLLLVFTGMTVFNLFNSGLLLGFLWVFFALIPLLDVKRKT